MKINLEGRNGEIIPISMEIENDKEAEFLLNQLRPKGEWILIKNSDGVLKCYECSECKKCQGYISNFCEDCGADMRKGSANV